MKYSVHKLLRLSWKIVMAGLVLPFSALTKAQVTLDGTLGPAGSLAGPNFVIPDTVGQTVGPNLFHSFGLFNINTGESATFRGPAAIDNVISRVTGGNQSFIDGLLHSEIESANLWFINPAGVLFGPNASLNVQGSFHVSTADYLRLGDGGRFEATNPENSVLTVAPPEAFGFLGERQPAGIAVQGSRLQVPAGETLSVVGGDIQIADGSLYAPGGRIDMVSVASPGEVLPNAPDLGVASFERLGRIEASHSSSERPLVDSSLPPGRGNVIGNVDASGEGGGRIFIRGGELVADNASIFADTRGGEESQGIDMGVTGQVTMRNGASITANTFSSGSGGDLIVKAGSLEMREGAFISASTFSSGHGGNLLVKAGSLEMRNRAFISADTLGSGSGGDLAVKAESLEVLGGAQIGAGTFGSGQGGNLLVEADRMLLSDISGAFSSGLFATANPGSSGDAGDLTVRAGSLEVREGAVISAGTFSSGDAGDLTVRAGSLEVRESANIRAGTNSTGRGGNLMITATDIVLGDEGVISARSTMTGLDTENDPEAGRSGNIFITARDTFRLFNGSRVSVETAQANAGDIILNVGTLLHLSDHSSLTTSVAGGKGNGGNITLDSVFIVLNEGSSIIANTQEGQGGNILIRILGGGALLQSPDSRIEASSEFGIDGSVVIDAPDTDIISGFAGLPANFWDAATVLTQLCAGRSGANVSSLVFRKYEVLPDSPYALRVQLPRVIPILGTAKQSRAPRTYYAGSPLPPMISCLGNG